jgi:hypothetical protein
LPKLVIFTFLGTAAIPGKTPIFQGRAVGICRLPRQQSARKNPNKRSGYFGIECQDVKAQDGNYALRIWPGPIGERNPDAIAA